MYVNQYETTNVYDLGLIQFKDEILHHALVREHLRNTLLAMVAQERRGEIVDRYVILCVRTVFSQVSAFQRCCQEHLQDADGSGYWE